MGTSDEIDDATISVDEAIILEIKATIAFPFQLSLTTIALQGRQRNLQKVCCTFIVIFSLIFSFPSSLCLHKRSSLVTLYHAKHAILDMQRFYLNNQRFA